MYMSAVIFEWNVSALMFYMSWWCNIVSVKLN